MPDMPSVHCLHWVYVQQQSDQSSTCWQADPSLECCFDQLHGIIIQAGGDLHISGSSVEELTLGGWKQVEQVWANVSKAFACRQS